jgi:GTPase
VSDEHAAPPPSDTDATATACGFAAIIGAPNAGKSTLTNQLVGAKVAIVTHKVQTTRVRLRGILIEGKTQIILVDTPGIFRPKRRLDRAMVDTAWSEAVDADVVVLLIDAGKGIDEEVDAILDRVAGITRPMVLAFNKIDRVRKDRLLELTAQLSARVNFAQVFMISALSGDGVDDLRAWVADAMPPGPWLYPEDQIADAPMRVMAAEVTREKVFLRLHDELPYESTVETADFKRLKDGSIRIEQVIYVARASQKKIVLGAGGRTIKQISTEAREELSQQLGVPVHLFLFVKVRERWAEDPSLYHAMGLEYPKR